VSAASDFQKFLGEQTTKLLGDEFRFFRSRLELRRRALDSEDVVVLGGSNKWSPCLSVAFYFGRRFDAARRVEKQLGSEGAFYHVFQHSLNLRKLSGLSYSGPISWEVDLRQPPPDLANQLTEAIQQVAFPFFARFETLGNARSGLLDEDAWCFSARGAFWRQLFLIDVALNDINHFRRWAESLDQTNFAAAQKALSQYDGQRALAPSDPLRVPQVK